MVKKRREEKTIKASIQIQERKANIVEEIKERILGFQFPQK